MAHRALTVGASSLTGVVCNAITSPLRGVPAGKCGSAERRGDCDAPSGKVHDTTSAIEGGDRPPARVACSAMAMSSSISLTCPSDTAQARGPLLRGCLFTPVGCRRAWQLTGEAAGAWHVPSLLEVMMITATCHRTPQAGQAKGFPRPQRPVPHHRALVKAPASAPLPLHPQYTTSTQDPPPNTSGVRPARRAATPV